MQRRSRSTDNAAPKLRLPRKPLMVHVVVPVEHSRGSVLKDYVGQSLAEVREGFQLRKNQSLDQSVMTEEVKLHSGYIRFRDEPNS